MSTGMSFASDEESSFDVATGETFVSRRQWCSIVGEGPLLCRSLSSLCKAHLGLFLIFRQRGRTCSPSADPSNFQLRRTHRSMLHFIDSRDPNSPKSMLYFCSDGANGRSVWEEVVFVCARDALRVLVLFSFFPFPRTYSPCAYPTNQINQIKKNTPIFPPFPPSNPLHTKKYQPATTTDTHAHAPQPQPQAQKEAPQAKK